MPDPETTTPEHILVIDDDRDIREDLKSYLTENGYRVLKMHPLRAGRFILKNQTSSCWTS